MLTVYTLAQCSTCKDAVNWLRSHGLGFEEKAIRLTPPTVPELERMLKAYKGELKRLFNTSGLEYRGLGMAEKLPTMTEAQAIKLLSTNGSLVKRPFLLGPNVGLVGFKADVWSAALIK